MIFIISIRSILSIIVNIWADPSEKGAYGFFDIMLANDLDDVIYDVKLGVAQYKAKT